MSRIVTADAFDALAELEAESVHAIVTDPPYGLAFMGRDWDTFDPREYQEWCEQWATLALDALKPGGHLLAFGGDRTHDLSQSGIRFAGFEIRPFMAWIHGQGFPKALDVSKAIDKAAGAEDERKVVGVKPGHEEFIGRDTDGHLTNEGKNEGWQRPWQDEDDADRYHMATAPATDAAKRWDGWKTALKPAIEPITCARKPFSGTVAENVQAHGTGALNIGETRLAPGDGGDRDGEATAEQRYTENGGTNFAPKPGPRGGSAEGRYPANVIFDADAAEALDREVGKLSDGGEFTVSKGGRENPQEDWEATKGMFRADRENVGIRDFGDKGGPSRYFYTSKATRAERTLDGKIENAHPTVKPVDLMEWLVRLVTAEGQTVLDPFCGTGTTCRAAKNLGRQFIGIERDPKWADVARARCGLTPDDPSLLTPEGQTTLSDTV